MSIKEYSAELIERKKLTDSVWHLEFESPNDFVFEAGQFISVNIPMADGRKLKRSYSLASTPKENIEKKRFALCLKDVGGPGSKYLCNLNLGDKINFIGIMGAFKIPKDIKDFKRECVFISTGVGVAPFRGMIPDLLEKGFKKKVVLITGYRNKGDTIYDNEFNDLGKKYKNFEYQMTLSQGTEKKKNARVQKLLEAYMDKNKKFRETEYYLCGLYEMIKEVGALLSKAGVPSENIFYERFD